MDFPKFSTMQTTQNTKVAVDFNPPNSIKTESSNGHKAEGARELPDSACWKRARVARCPKRELQGAPLSTPSKKEPGLLP